MAKFLVTYASKRNATKGIAFEVARQLEENGQTVTIMPVEKVETIDPYDAVVLGSAVYAERWQKSAIDFVKAHVDALAQRSVWIFSSGPTGVGDPVELLEGFLYPEALSPYIDRIQPQDVTVFHGKLNMDDLAFWERMIVRGLKSPLGDYRDWEAIRGWALGIAAAMAQDKSIEY